jgi:hypothetical protein
MEGLLKKCEDSQFKCRVEFHFVLHSPAFKPHTEVFGEFNGNVHALESMACQGRAKAVQRCVCFCFHSVWSSVLSVVLLSNFPGATFSRKYLSTIHGKKGWHSCQIP